MTSSPCANCGSATKNLKGECWGCAEEEPHPYAPGVMISSPPDLSSGPQLDPSDYLSVSGDAVHFHPDGDARRAPLPKARTYTTSWSGIEILALMIMMFVLALLTGMGIRLLS